jgi:hypothetical protein
MFFRIYFPGPVLTAVFGPVTFALVLGYVSCIVMFDSDLQSYLNATLGSLTEATWGWDVAWRRFLSVAIGITAAWIFAYRKPSTRELADISPALLLRPSGHQAHIFPIDHCFRSHTL